jgi:hypothetical protein
MVILIFSQLTHCPSSFNRQKFGVSGMGVKGSISFAAIANFHAYIMQLANLSMEKDKLLGG